MYYHLVRKRDDRRRGMRHSASRTRGGRVTTSTVETSEALGGPLTGWETLPGSEPRPLPLSFLEGPWRADEGGRVNLRIIVTGSRHWTSAQLVHEALVMEINRVGWWDWTAAGPAKVCPPIGGEVTIVHGGCATGADAIASAWAKRHAVREEVHRADWRSHGAKAGPLRNHLMATLGADVVLAFVLPCAKADCNDPRPHMSHGTGSMIRYAREAGIRVVEIEEQ